MNDRLPGTSWSNPIWYKRYRIFQNDYWFTPNDQWAYVHDDYDGAEDSGDNRYGTGPTPQACKDEIDEAGEGNV